MTASDGRAWFLSQISLLNGLDRHPARVNEKTSTISAFPFRIIELPQRASDDLTLSSCNWVNLHRESGKTPQWCDRSVRSSFGLGGIRKALETLHLSPGTANLALIFCNGVVCTLGRIVEV